MVLLLVTRRVFTDRGPTEERGTAPGRRFILAAPLVLQRIQILVRIRRLEVSVATTLLELCLEGRGDI